jgi:hypothetical protein
MTTQEENGDELMVRTMRHLKTTSANIFWFACVNEGFKEAEREARDRYHQWMRGFSLPDFVRRYCRNALQKEP